MGGRRGATTGSKKGVPGGAVTSSRKVAGFAGDGSRLDLGFTGGEQLLTIDNGEALTVYGVMGTAAVGCGGMAMDDGGRTTGKCWGESWAADSVCGQGDFVFLQEGGPVGGWRSITVVIGNAGHGGGLAVASTSHAFVAVGHGRDVLVPEGLQEKDLEVAPMRRDGANPGSFGVTRRRLQLDLELMILLRKCRCAMGTEVGLFLGGLLRCHLRRNGMLFRGSTMVGTNVNFGTSLGWLHTESDGARGVVGPCLSHTVVMGAEMGQSRCGLGVRCCSWLICCYLPMVVPRFGVDVLSVMFVRFWGQIWPRLWSYSGGEGGRLRWWLSGVSSGPPPHPFFLRRRARRIGFVGRVFGDVGGCIAASCLFAGVPGCYCNVFFLFRLVGSVWVCSGFVFGFAGLMGDRWLVLGTDWAETGVLQRWWGWSAPLVAVWCFFGPSPLPDFLRRRARRLGFVGTGVGGRGLLDCRQLPLC